MPTYHTDLVYRRTGNGRGHDAAWLAAMPPFARERYAARLLAYESAAIEDGRPEDYSLGQSILQAERDLELCLQRCETARKQRLAAWQEARREAKQAAERLDRLMALWFERAAPGKREATKGVGSERVRWSAAESRQPAAPRAERLRAMREAAADDLL